MCRAWAWCKIVPAIGTSAYAFLLQRELWSRIAQQNAIPNAPRGFLDLMAGIGGAATLVVGLLWGSALPVFMLIWLGPPKIRADLSGWR